MSGKQIRRTFIIAAIAFVLLAFALWAAFYYNVHAPNVDLGEDEYVFFTIAEDQSYQEVVSALEMEGFINNLTTFKRVAERKNYPSRLTPGRYRITDGMSNNQLVNMLRSGMQHPVRLTFNNIRTREELASSISVQLQLDSADIISVLNNTEDLAEFGMDSITSKLLFIPDTYEVYWTITADQLLERMIREYQRFWNNGRLEKASSLGFSPLETGILASIVQSETNKREEMPRIAGVYINRLERGIPLQADPTVIYALGDFGIRRVLNHHLTYDSPYNTYLYAGLPPGPINLPEPIAIDAVLNYEEHNYLYFTARHDFSGYHVFAETYREHLRNARQYREALNEMNIYR